MVINLVALKAECTNNPKNYSATVDGVTMTLAQWFAGGFDQVCADILNVVEAAFFVYRTSVPIAELQNAVNWANYTPLDAIPLSAANGLTYAETLLLWQTRAIKAQGMQMNLQNIILGAQGVLNAANPGVRSGLTDAMTNLPTGASGAPLSGGWGTVRDTVLARAATRAEKLFASKTVQQDGTSAAKAATLTFEGLLSSDDVKAARMLP